MQVSARILRCKRACTEQVEKFKELFGGDNVVITKELCVKHAQDFDWNWAAKKLLPESLRAEYEAKRAPLLAEYDAKIAPLLAEYDAKIAPLLAEYRAKHAPLLAEYEAKYAPLRAEYGAKRASLRAEYAAKIAGLFGELVERN
jgi:hypothetical protein